MCALCSRLPDPVRQRARVALDRARRHLHRAAPRRLRTPLPPPRLPHLPSYVSDFTQPLHLLHLFVIHIQYTLYKRLSVYGYSTRI